MIVMGMVYSHYNHDGITLISFSSQTAQTAIVAAEKPIPSHLIIRSSAMGIWGDKFINALMLLAFPGHTFEWSAEKTPHLLVHSHFVEDQPVDHSLVHLPYIAWSGEPFTRNLQIFNKDPVLYIMSYETRGRELLPNVPLLQIPYVTYGVLDANYRPDDILLWRPPYATRLYLIAYATSKCWTQREEMFRLLFERCPRGVLECHALGPCSNNMEDLRRKDPTAYEHIFPISRAPTYRNPYLFRNYRFTLVFENTDLEGYVTEKIVNAFKGNSIPIYFGGGGMIDQLFNPKAFIDARNFSSPEACADFVMQLSRDSDRLVQMYREPVFRDNLPPDSLRGLDSMQWKEVARKLRQRVQAQLP